MIITRFVVPVSSGICDSWISDLDVIAWTRELQMDLPDVVFSPIRGWQGHFPDKKLLRKQILSYSRGAPDVAFLPSCASFYTNIS